MPAALPADRLRASERAAAPAIAKTGRVADQRVVRNVHAVDADGDLVCELNPWRRDTVPGMTWSRVHPSQRCPTCHVMVEGHGSEFGVAIARLR